MYQGTEVLIFILSIDTHKINIYLRKNWSISLICIKNRFRF